MLKDMQQKFCQDILYGALDEMQPHVQGRGDRVENAFFTYINNVNKSLFDVITSTFEKTLSVIPINQHRDIFKNYLNNAKPQTGILSEYGYDFPHFIQSINSVPPALHEVASFDWLLNKVSYVEPDFPVNPKEFSCIPEDQFEGLKFKFIAGFILCNLSEDAASLIEIDSRFQVLLRPMHQVSCIGVDQKRFEFLRALHQGENLSEAYNVASKKGVLNIQEELLFLIKENCVRIIEN